MKEIKIFYSKDWQDYELLDTGEGEKLERFGSHTFVRPYEDAVWPKCATSDVAQKKWKSVDGKFEKKWHIMSKAAFDIKWVMEYKGIKFFAKPTPFRHLGFFPEQAYNWDFIERSLAGENVENFSPLLHPTGGTFRLQNSPHSRPPRFLNLFGYTGVASLFALRAGAEVTHVDASKQILTWAKENEKLNPGIGSMRVIEDDAIKFLEREAKRGNKYDAIIMDPPKFGRGPKGEVWKIEEALPKLLSLVQKVLSDKPLFVILNSYATDSSALSLGYALESIFPKDDPRGGQVEAGELCLLEKSNGRMISLANVAIWSKI